MIRAGCACMVSCRMWPRGVGRSSWDPTARTTSTQLRFPTKRSSNFLHRSPALARLKLRHCFVFTHVARSDSEPPLCLIISAWLTDSVVLHASSPNPHGPYAPVDIALGPRGKNKGAFWDSLTMHNPAAVKAPDGTYLLYYMGNNCQGGICAAGSIANCLKNTTTDKTPVCTQRVGLATAQSPAGVDFSNLVVSFSG
jgi:hypothetical protein